MQEIQRATELFIIEQLRTAVPNYLFVPFSGGDRTADAQDIEPPFTVISIDSASHVMATEGTWLCDGTAQIVSHAAESTSASHSELVRKIYAALDNVTPTTGDTYSFHGIDIQTMRSSSDEGNQVHADIIDFSCGVGG